MKNCSFPQVSTLATVASFFLVLALFSAAYAIETDLSSVYNSLSDDVGEHVEPSVADRPEETGGGSRPQQQSPGAALQGPSASKSGNSPQRRRSRSSTRLSHTLSPKGFLGGISGSAVKLLVAVTVFAVAVLVFSRLAAMVAKCLEHIEPLSHPGSSPRLLSGSRGRSGECELGEVPRPGRSQRWTTWVATLIAAGTLIAGLVAYLVLRSLGEATAAYAESVLTFCFLGSVAFYGFFLYMRVQEEAREGLADPAASNLPPATLEFYIVVALLFSSAMYIGFVAAGVPWLLIVGGLGMAALIVATNWHLNQREQRLRDRETHQI